MFKVAYKISAGQGLFVHATCARDCGALLRTLSGNCVGLMPRGLRSELSSLMFDVNNLLFALSKIILCFARTTLGRYRLRVVVLESATRRRVVQY